MYRNLLVALDGSPSAEHALPLACSIARRSSANLRLVNVLPPLASVYVEPPLFAAGDGLDERIKTRFREYLDYVASRIEKTLGLKANAELLEGEIVPTLQSHAKEMGADLVVMTTHGRGPFGRFWLGSVADELVRMLPMPLLLVRPPDADVDLATEPPLRNVLVPLDGKPLAERMIGPAVKLGRLTGASYTLLRVIKPVTPFAAPTGSPVMDVEVRHILDRIEKVEGQLREQASNYLDGVARPLRAEGLKVATKLALEERPGIAILQEAAKGGADLIAIETHGRHGLPRLLLGSVADKVIRGSTIPILVHRPSENNVTNRPE